MQKSTKYLIKALESYREVSYGQFDTESSEEVEITQDAAETLKDYAEDIDELIALFASALESVPGSKEYGRLNEDRIRFFRKYNS